MIQVSDNCFRLFRHWVKRAFSLAFDTAASTNPASTAMMEIATSSSRSENPRHRRRSFMAFLTERCRKGVGQEGFAESAQGRRFQSAAGDAAARGNSHNNEMDC